MKTQINAKPANIAANPPGPRAAVMRASVAKTFERRNERRKIREQLRRPDWALNGEDEVFA
jgi:hypothetical protein